MSRVYTNVAQLVGATPLMKLSNLIKDKNLKANVFAKLEFMNPAGSVKDRVAKAIIEDAEKSGRLVPGATIIEPTSGNTGIGLASIAASKGYKVVLTMPDTMSVERRKLLAAYGAKIELTPGSEGMNGAVKKAEELLKTIPNSILAGQFTNPINPKAHEETTGPEIWDDLDGNVDAFIAGVGTGGTLSGTGRYLKSKNSNVKIVAIEPSDSPLLSKGKAGPHPLQGIGANFVPETLDTKVYDEIMTITGKDAYEMANYLAKHEGILVGITSGASVYGALQLALRPEFEGKNIVALLPDTGERYLSAGVFD
ncbi:MAG: cysteine synthase A [Alphaproteobacteria bacterium]|nr:cysteine synthase A [Alphaproteobacteria bacterium]